MFYLPCEPVDANLVHVVGEALAGLELEGAEHVVGEGGGGQAEAREQQQQEHVDKLEAVPLRCCSQMQPPRNIPHYLLFFYLKSR